MTVGFSFTSNAFQVTFTGTGFDGSTSNVDVYIDGEAQTIVSVSATQVVAKITSMLDMSTTDIKLYLQSGTPDGYSILSTGIAVTPHLISVTP